jgi:Zn-dependent protease with chaperone function
MNIARMSSTGVALLLYTTTLVGQLFSALVRVLSSYIILALLALITGWPIPSNTLALVIGFGPLAVSLLALIIPPLILPIDGRWWEISSGGRPPEQDEREAFDDAIGQLQEVDPDLRVPRHWFVAEDPDRNAAAYAKTMRVDRGLLESPYTAAVLAHELGHLNSSDGRLSSAIRLMLIAEIPTPTIRPLPSLPFRGLAWIASGAAVLRFMDNPWEMYWRSREFAADQYAARLGQGLQLSLHLESEALPYERPIHRMRYSRATHPYTKSRIARLHVANHPAPRTPTRTHETTRTQNDQPQQPAGENQNENPPYDPTKSLAQHLLDKTARTRRDEP